MAAAGEQRPIIVIKKKVHGGHGHHGGAWKVAFADFVTAMMALFMVLWLVAQSPKTKSAVGAYFRDPLGFEGGGNTELNTGPSTGGAGFFQGGNTAIALDTEFARGMGTSQLHQEQEMTRLSNARNRLAQALMALRTDSWARHVELTAVEEGLRIEIEDSDETQLFPAGSTRLDPKAHNVLRTIAKELAMLPNHLVIEGHTDGAGFSKGGGKVTNWEVSTDRANAARRFLAENGVRDDQIVEVRGYSDRRPRIWHDPENARNRRISVLVLLERAAKREEPLPNEAPHPLVERLRQLDYAAQGPTKRIELEPSGALQPGQPALRRLAPEPAPGPTKPAPTTPLILAPAGEPPAPR